MPRGRSDVEWTVVPSWFTPHARLEFIGEKIGEKAYEKTFGEPAGAEAIERQKEYSKQVSIMTQIFFTLNFFYLFAFGLMDIMMSLLYQTSYVLQYTTGAHGLLLTIFGTPIGAAHEIMKKKDDISKYQSKGYKHGGVFIATFGSLLMLFVKISPAKSFTIPFGLAVATATLLMFDWIAREIDPEDITLDWFIKPLDVKAALKSGFNQTFTRIGVRKSILIGLLTLWLVSEINMVLFQIHLGEILTSFGWKANYPRPDAYYEAPVTARLMVVLSSSSAVIHQFISTANVAMAAEASREQVMKATVARIGLRVTNIVITVALFVILAIFLNNKIHDATFVIIVVSVPSIVALYLYSNFVFVPHAILKNSNPIRSAIRTSWRIASGNRIGIVALRCSATTSGYGMFLVFLLVSFLMVILLNVFMTVPTIPDVFAYIPVTISLGFYIAFRIFTFVDAFNQLEKEERRLAKRKPTVVHKSFNE